MTDSFALMIASVWAGIAAICYFATKEDYPPYVLVAVTAIGGLVTLALTIGG